MFFKCRMRFRTPLIMTDRAAKSSLDPKSQLEKSIGKRNGAGNERSESDPEGV